MLHIMKEYSNKELKVIWNPEKCIHAGECTRGLPEVFCREAKPWINMNGAGSEEIMKVVDRCPSGALTYMKAGSEEGGMEEKGSKESTNSACAQIMAVKDGPLLVAGRAALVRSNGKVIVEHGPYALCRCGGSGKKPFCDGTHIKIGFKD
jgi:uncharacterized Fe-S cluster protein YjdI